MRLSTLTKLIILFFVCIGLITAHDVSAAGTKKNGEACSDSNECQSNTCDDSYCTCGESGTTSASCAYSYGATAADWKCVNESQDPDKMREEWNFCQKNSFSNSLPKTSTDDVKYPVETKALLGFPCNDDDLCWNPSGTAGICEESTLNGVSSPSDPLYDPWHIDGRKLKVCTIPVTVPLAGLDMIAQGFCEHQYGSGTWFKADGTGELTGLRVCAKAGSPVMSTLKEMRKSIVQDEDATNKTTIFGFDATIPNIELEQPAPKITIPGVIFSKISKESSITTDETGASWLNVPFLGEYISAIYKYSVGLISLIAVMVLIISGVQIITSAGSSETISAAKHRIISSVIAIALTAGSYTILYTINPELVNLRNLKILVVAGKPLEVPVSQISAANYKAITGQDLKLDKGSRDANVQLAVLASQQNNLDPCFAFVVIGKESGGNAAIVGHDEDYPGPNGVNPRYYFLKSGKKKSGQIFDPPSNLPETAEKYQALTPAERLKVNSVNISNDDGAGPNRHYADLGSPPDYGLDWRTGLSHGFGLGQRTFGGNSYCDKSKGIRGWTSSISKKCFTVADLLTPAGGVDAFVSTMIATYPYAKTKANYTGPSNDISDLKMARWMFAMYGAGLGGGNINRESINQRVELYKKCKATGIVINVPANAKPAILETAASGQEDTTN